MREAEGDDLDDFAGEPAPRRVAEARQSDPAVSPRDPPGDGPGGSHHVVVLALYL